MSRNTTMSKATLTNTKHHAKTTSTSVMTSTSKVVSSKTASQSPANTGGATSDFAASSSFALVVSTPSGERVTWHVRAHHVASPPVPRPPIYLRQLLTLLRFASSSVRWPRSSIYIELRVPLFLSHYASNKALRSTTITHSRSIIRMAMQYTGRVQLSV